MTTHTSCDMKLDSELPLPRCRIPLTLVLPANPKVGLGVLTAPRLSVASCKSGGGVRTPSPTFPFVGSLHFQRSDAQWDHEPPEAGRARCPHRAETFRGVQQVRWRGEDTQPYLPVRGEPPPPTIGRALGP